MTTRVGIIGNFSVPYTSESHWARAFAENGCEVTPIQVDDAVHNPNEAMNVLRSQTLVTYTRTHAPGRYLDPSWTQRWHELEDSGVCTVGIHLDRFFDLEREHLVTREPRDAQFTMGLVATADGGHDVEFGAAGVNHWWFRPGVDRVEAQMFPAICAPEHDQIVFTGSGASYHDSYRQRGDLIRFLHDRYGAQFVHYGHGGDRPVVRQAALNEVLQRAAIVVGDSCFANSPGWRIDTRRYVSDRLYESIGRGAFLLFPRLPDMERDFGITPGAHCAVYEPGDWTDLAATISFYLDAPEERTRIAAAGRAHVLGHHTYTTRMGELLAVVGLEPSRAVSGGGVV